MIVEKVEERMRHANCSASKILRWNQFVLQMAGVRRPVFDYIRGDTTINYLFERFSRQSGSACQARNLLSHFCLFHPKMLENQMVAMFFYIHEPQTSLPEIWRNPQNHLKFLRDACTRDYLISFWIRAEKLLMRSSAHALHLRTTRGLELSSIFFHGYHLSETKHAKSTASTAWRWGTGP